MTVNPVHRELNRPLTYCGAQREHFMSALTLGAVGWLLFSTLIGGLALFLVFFGLARHITRTDPKLPYILFRARSFRAECDPRRWKPVRVVLLRSHA